MQARRARLGSRAAPCHPFYFQLPQPPVPCPSQMQPTCAIRRCRRSSRSTACRPEGKSLELQPGVQQCSVVEGSEGPPQHCQLLQGPVTTLLRLATWRNSTSTPGPHRLNQVTAAPPPPTHTGGRHPQTHAPANRLPTCRARFSDSAAVRSRLCRSRSIFCHGTCGTVGCGGGSSARGLHRRGTAALAFSLMPQHLQHRRPQGLMRGHHRATQSTSASWLHEHAAGTSP